MGAVVAYVSREQVKRALDVKATAIVDDQIDSAIYSGADAIEGKTLRKFYPRLGTERFNWPNRQYSDTWQLWLESREAINLSEVVSGGDTLDSAGYFLTNAAGEPGPPYGVLELDQATSATFNAGASWQRSLTLTGVWGYTDATTPAGALAAGAPGTMDASQTSVTVINGSLFNGVRTLDTILIGTEYMTVTARAPVDTGQDIATTALTATASDQGVAVADSSVFAAGEQITIDTETMWITRVLPGVLVVKRAWDGSTLAAHSIGASIYADRTLTLQRGVLGSTAAAHTASTAVARLKPPALVQSLNLALAVNEFLQQGSGYVMTVGSGDNEREAAGKAITALWARVCQAYGRTARTEAV